MKLSPLFSEGCVIRQGPGSRVWGRCEPNENVTVGFRGREYRTNAGSGGGWAVEFGDLSPGGPFELCIAAESGGLTLREVYVGEVWLCAGQSNMQITFTRIGRRYPQVMSAAPEPRIRQFAVPPEYDFTAPRAELAGGAWTHASPDTIADFSAAGYFFAKRRVERYGVPVGMITAAVGGTPIRCWMEADITAPENGENLREPGMPESGDPCDPTVTQSPGGVIWWLKRVNIPMEFAGRPSELALGTIVDADVTYVNGAEVGRTEYRYPPRYYPVPPLPEGEAVIAVRQSIFGGWGKFTENKTRELRFPSGVISLDGDWERRRESWAAIPPEYIPADHAPCGYYNAMIAPLTRFQISGALWYQGESDAATPDRYAEKFAKMLGGWRESWGWLFPMLTVGLARYDEADWTALREQQRECLKLPNVGYFDAWDCGEPNDLHPLDKKTVGDGLAEASFAMDPG